MKILVSGGTGLLGNAFARAASGAGYAVTVLSRKATPGAIRWDPGAGSLDASAIEGFDAVVHLAGENIAAGRWTVTQKKRILDSRVQGTQLLSSTLSQLKHPPSVLISASAIGFYGDCGDRTLTEESPAGVDFLADVCRAWEEATKSAEGAGIRVVHLRTGIVLAREGGALQKMLTPFKLSLGGKIGSGRQFMSWIDIEDEVNAILHCISRASMSGAVNAVGPSPVTNAEFTNLLGKVLGRPTILPLPAFAARLVLGEMADALLLSSQRVEPSKLLADGFNFRHRSLEESLRRIIKGK